jgi:hypothetical protein
MNVKKRLETIFQGWLPKEPKISYMHTSSKSRWRNPFWIVITLVSVVVLAGFTFQGVNAYLRYSMLLRENCELFHRKRRRYC